MGGARDSTYYVIMRYKKQLRHLFISNNYSLLII